MISLYLLCFILLVAGTFLFSAILQFVGLGLVYNLDKKTLAKMNEELGRSN